MEKHEVIYLAEKLIDEHGLEGWSFKIDKAKRRVGVCCYRTKEIGMSDHFLPHLKEETVRNTLLHEIAHALVGPGHGHGKVWKAKAREIGCTAERCTDTGHIEVHFESASYLGVCDKCGARFVKHRKPRLRRGARYVHNRCGGHIEFLKNK